MRVTRRALLLPFVLALTCLPARPWPGRARAPGPRRVVAPARRRDDRRFSAGLRRPAREGARQHRRHGGEDRERGLLAQPAVPGSRGARYREFDFPAVLIREAHARGIAVHAWFFDFAEGANSHVAQTHPEWLALSPDGKPTTAEILRGQPYRMAWMCPARRPGYTDQWLIPLIKEFAERYDVDAIHHDYVRYPGDLAPDTYCFCDYCLKHLPEYASYSLAGPAGRSAHLAVRPAAPRGALGTQPEGAAAELGPVFARDEEPAVAGRQLLPRGKPRPGLLLLRVPRAPRRRVHAAGVRGDSEGEPPNRRVGRGVQEPGAERSFHRTGLAAFLAVGAGT